MKTGIILLMVFISTFSIGQNLTSSNTMQIMNDSVKIKLPDPKLTGKVSVEEALAKRRSVREYKDTLLTLEELSQILWAAYGITDTVKRNGIGLHTAPSAMALYPLTVYLVAGNVKGLKSGIYRYHPKEHYLEFLKSGDFRGDLCAASNNQEMIKKAPFDLVYSVDTLKMNSKFGKEAGIMLACLDLGHSAENVYLQATAIQLGTCVIAGLKPEKVATVLNLPANEKAFYIMPVGKLKDK